MLVLTRRCGEQITIGDEIVVTIVAVIGNKVRIAIEAPRSVRVDRKEVHDRRLAESPSLSYELDIGCPVG
jgi:carbon storage regulator